LFKDSYKDSRIRAKSIQGFTQDTKHCNLYQTSDLHVSYQLVSQINVSFTYYLYRFMSHLQSLKALVKDVEYQGM